jgi:hypothetical protein
MHVARISLFAVCCALMSCAPTATRAATSPTVDDGLGRIYAIALDRLAIKPLPDQTIAPEGHLITAIEAVRGTLIARIPLQPDAAALEAHYKLIVAAFPAKAVFPVLLGPAASDRPAYLTDAVQVRSGEVDPLTILGADMALSSAASGRDGWWNVRCSDPFAALRALAKLRQAAMVAHPAVARMQTDKSAATER